MGFIALCIGSSVAFAQPRVGAYYYPWYGPFEGGHSVAESLRGRLVDPQLPDLADYSSRDPLAITRHIEQSQQANINFWAVSWWGPTSPEDVTFRESLLANPLRSQLDYAVHYETTGRLGPPGAPDFTNLLPDFRYLAETYFSDPDYLRIDGRPVVFLYLTQAYFDGPAAADSVAQLRAAMQTEFGVDPYLIGDDLFNFGVTLPRAQLWDAISGFDVYGAALRGVGSTQAALDKLAGIYEDARETLAGTGVAFVPTATPGYNDTAVRDGNHPAPRFFEDEPESREGDLFDRMLREVTVPNIDPAAGNILMINSFNEWHEDTQIEPVPVTPPTIFDDSHRYDYTKKYVYRGYGDLYLDILREATLSEPLTLRAPEPSSWLLLALGAALLAAWRMKKWLVCIH